jgi:hypothetical protein
MNMTLSSPLVQAFHEHPRGLCGQHEPARVVSTVEDLEKRLTILALGVVLDINTLSRERWSRLASLAGHWLLNPSHVAYQSSQEVGVTMQEMRILGGQHIPRVWWQICRGMQGRFKGSWRKLLDANEDSAQKLQSYLQQNRTTFPVLAGPVISARWLDLTHRIGGSSLHGWENLLIPLSKKQVKTAGLFGIRENVVHPLLFNALLVWTAACKKLPEEYCGLGVCPGRSS